jgi:hypothetical protein
MGKGMISPSEETMQKQSGLRVATAIALGVWLLMAWATQFQVSASQTVPMLPAISQAKPLQQTCTGVDLQIGSVTFDPNPPTEGQSYNVHVEIINTGTESVAEDSWTGVYLGGEPPPAGTPIFEREVPANTAGLTITGTVISNLTIPSEYATAGYHYIWVEVNVDGHPIMAAECAGGNANNVSNPPYQIFIPADATPTTEPPTPTPFPLPQVYFFNPGDVTVVRGNPVTLAWQVYGDSVGVTLDGAPVPMEDSREIFPTDNHVYTLRAENPGGIVERTCRITVVGPTATPTPTATPCTLPVIYEFNATRTSIVRGEKTTLYWDLSGATSAYLDGSGVAGVAEKTVTLYQTTVFVLRAVNGCGEVQDTLQVTVRYATPTPTRTPTRTPTPTYTPRPPTATPTRNVLPTWTPTTATATTLTATQDLATPPTVGPQVPTITPGVISTESAFDSPLETPTPVPQVVPTNTITPTATTSLEVAATNTVQPEPTGRLATVTPTPAWNTDAPTSTPPPVAQNITPTAEQPAEMATPAPSPTLATGIAGTMRMYLCPLGILIIFALSVLVLSVVLPRIRERREAQEALPLQPTDTVFDPGEPLVASHPAPARAVAPAPVIEDPVSIEINDLLPRREAGSIDESVSIEINDRAIVDRS